MRTCNRSIQPPRFALVGVFEKTAEGVGLASLRSVCATLFFFANRLRARSLPPIGCTRTLFETGLRKVNSGFSSRSCKVFKAPRHKLVPRRLELFSLFLHLQEIPLEGLFHRLSENFQLNRTESSNPRRV